MTLKKKLVKKKPRLSKLYSNLHKLLKTKSKGKKKIFVNEKNIDWELNHEFRGLEVSIEQFSEALRKKDSEKALFALARLRVSLANLSTIFELTQKDCDDVIRKFLKSKN